jgi:membrane fusion protein (multidrug efflux system)
MADAPTPPHAPSHASSQPPPHPHGHGHAAAHVPAPADNSRNHYVLGAIAAAIVIAGIVYGVHWWRYGRFIESTDDAYLRADQVAVAPRVLGYIDQVYVTDNQMVKAGQPLVRIDVRNYRAALNQQTATVDARAADIAAVQNQITQQQAAVAQSRAQLAIAEANAAYTRAETARYQSLRDQGVETDERYAQVANQRDVAAAQEQSATANLEAAQKQILTLQSQVQQAKAQLEAAQAAVHTAQLNVDDTVINASIDGRVGDNGARVGQFVQPGTRLMTLVPVQDVYLVANYKETQIQRMRVGQPVQVHIDALGDGPIEGVVESFAPGTGAQFALLPPENATGNFTKIVQRVPVRIHLKVTPDVASRLLPGLSVTASVDTRGEKR